MWWLLLGCEVTHLDDWRRVHDPIVGAPQAPWSRIWLSAEVCERGSWDHRLIQRENCREAFDKCGAETHCGPINPSQAIAVEDSWGDLRVYFSDGDLGFWAAETELEPGDWRVALIENDLDVRAHELDFTLEPSASPGAGTWRVLLRGSPASEYANAFVETWLVLDEPEPDGAVEFAVVGRYQDYPQCVFLRGVGELEEGSFSWSAERMGANSEPEVESHDLWMRAWFLEDGTGVGGEAHALIDMRHLKAREDTAQICDTIGLWESCSDPCPDGEAECMDIDLWEMPLTPTEPIDPDALVPCGYDARLPELSWSCDFEWPEGGLCSTAGVLTISWPAAWLAFALLRRRRRPPSG